ncbi:hypothetical protein SAMN05421853_12315 [Roseivivax halotolerans]|uniref:Helix-turn-helix domain-containing protein n=1 Tax=Roseivivax halotolerans TaxID=93684 RepID=A0A1I6AKF5_9RHOB|nr:hypothetical protein [Roseivivax halotolerans]SFQ69201.1 hypothetical protein SAMN05421853_12315 [Roseivivax halotolerans]
MKHATFYAAAYANVSDTTVRKAIRNGQLRAARNDRGAWEITPQGLRGWWDRHCPTEPQGPYSSQVETATPDVETEMPEQLSQFLPPPDDDITDSDNDDDQSFAELKAELEELTAKIEEEEAQEKAESDTHMTIREASRRLGVEPEFLLEEIRKSFLVVEPHPADTGPAMIPIHGMGGIEYWDKSRRKILMRRQTAEELRAETVSAEDADLFAVDEMKADVDGQVDTESDDDAWLDEPWADDDIYDDGIDDEESRHEEEIKRIEELTSQMVKLTEAISGLSDRLDTATSPQRRRILGIF